MKALKTILIVFFAVLLVGGGITAAGGYFVYGQVKELTMPKIQKESMQSYAINIANSLIKNRELEIPPEILSNIITEQSGIDTACLVTDDNRLQIWFSDELEYIGKADICFTMRLDSYDKSTGALAMNIEDISVGTLKIPEFLKPSVLKIAGKFAGEKITVADKAITFVIEKFTAEVMGMSLSVGIDSISIKDGKMYFALFANAE